MISSLLDASRSNAGERLVLEAGDCEVRGMLDDIIGDLEPRAQQRVLLDMPAAIHAFWDCEKIRRAVYNLVENAIKYSHADSTVDVRAVESHGRVQVSVHNYGDPIPQEEQQIRGPLRQSFGCGNLVGSQRIRLTLRLTLGCTCV